MIIPERFDPPLRQLEPARACAENFGERFEPSSLTRSVEWSDAASAPGLSSLFGALCLSRSVAPASERKSV